MVQLKATAVQLEAASSGFCRRNARLQGVSLVGSTQIGDAKSHGVFDHHDLAAPNTFTVHEQVDILTGGTRKLDDRVLAEFQYLGNLHPLAVQLNRKLDRHIPKLMKTAEPGGNQGRKPWLAGCLRAGRGVRLWRVPRRHGFSERLPLQVQRLLVQLVGGRDDPRVRLEAALISQQVRKLLSNIDIRKLKR